MTVRIMVRVSFRIMNRLMVTGMVRRGLWRRYMFIDEVKFNVEIRVMERVTLTFNLVFT